MEAGEFADWLSGIGRLSNEQIALALTELGAFAGRSDDVSLRPSAEARPEGESSTEEGERRKARIERDALATIGERKVERLGCAHCGADEIVGWGRSHGCRGIAARRAGAPSTPRPGRGWPGCARRIAGSTRRRR